MQTFTVVVADEGSGPMATKRSLQVPSGTAIAMFVSTRIFPLFGTVVTCEAYMSYPAANALPLVGALADGESFLTSRGGDWEIVVTGGASAEEGKGGAIIFWRLDNGDVGDVGGWW